MRKSLVYLSILLIFGLWLSSCTKEVKLDLPKTKSQLAVFGYLSPEDTLCSIAVKRTKPLFQNLDYNVETPISNAQVLIEHNNTTYTLKYDENSKQYSIKTSEMPIVAGEKYSLKVSADGFPDAKSSITIQKSRNESLKFVERINESNIKIKWQDEVSERNFYRLEGFTQDISMNYFKLSNDVLIFEDSQWNGLERTSSDLYLYKEEGDTNKQLATLILLSTDEPYYLYHKSLNDQQAFSGNPFSEPVVVYSNIENGVGVFCSYRKYEIEVEL